MEDHRDFYEWYKTKITANDQDPPEDAWQNIADELDTNEVWDRIAVQLDRPSGWFSRATYYALPALLLLLLSGGAYYYANKTDHTFAEPGEVAINKDGINAEANKDAALDGDESPSPKAEDLIIEESGEAAIEDENAANADQPDNAVPEQTANPTVGKDDATAEEPEDATVTNADNVTIDEVGDTDAAKLSRTDVGETETDISIILRESKVDDKNAISNETDHLVKDEDVEASTSFDKDIDSFNANDTSLSTTHRETPSALIEGMATERARTTRTSDSSKERGILLLDRRAGILSVTMPDSMLSIHPVFVSLHPDSLGWISATTDPEKIRYTRTIEFGITASAKNTWLLNRTTLSGLEKHTLTATLPDFGKDIGMVFAWNFSPVFSAQAEGMFISEAGQRYKEYRNGKYVTRDVDLRYYTLNVLLKYNRSRAVYGLPLSGHSIIGGLYGSMLNKATETISGESIDRSNAYQNMNYGVILGYEYNRYVLPNVVVSSGLRLNYGFPNIDSSLFSRTFTGSLDLNVSVRYRL